MRAYRLVMHYTCTAPDLKMFLELLSLPLPPIRRGFNTIHGEKAECLLVNCQPIEIGQTIQMGERVGRIKRLMLKYFHKPLQHYKVSDLEESSPG